MFVEVCEWFDGCDRLKIIVKSRKNKITKLSFILNMIKNYHYVSLICCRKNINMYKWIIQNFIINNYYLNLF